LKKKKTKKIVSKERDCNKISAIYLGLDEHEESISTLFRDNTATTTKLLISWLKFLVLILSNVMIWAAILWEFQ
jgi:hypothetical protein